MAVSSTDAAIAFITYNAIFSAGAPLMVHILNPLPCSHVSAGVPTSASHPECAICGGSAIDDRHHRHAATSRRHHDVSGWALHSSEWSRDGLQRGVNPGSQFTRGREHFDNSFPSGRRSCDLQSSSAAFNRRAPCRLGQLEPTRPPVT
jgi:hypothetical protein